MTGETYEAATAEERKGIVRLHRWRWMVSMGFLASLTVVPLGAKWIGLHGDTLATVGLSAIGVACLAILMMIVMIRCPRCGRRATASVLSAEFGAPPRCNHCGLDLRRRPARQPR